VRNAEMFEDIDYSIRTIKLINRIIVVMNPDTIEHQFYERFLSPTPKNCLVIKTNYLDNFKNLSQSFIDAAKDLKFKNPKKYREVMLGAWKSKREGLVFEFEIIETEPEGYTIYGLDFGFSTDETALVKCVFGNTYIYCEEISYKLRQTTDELIQFLNESKFSKSNLIIADSASPERIAQIAKAGYNIKAVKPKPLVKDSIESLKAKKIFIDCDSKNLKHEFNNYTEEDVVRSVGINHGIDAIRYAHQEFILRTPKKPSSTVFEIPNIRRK